MWTEAKEPCWLQTLQEARTRDQHELQGVGKSWEPVSSTSQARGVSYTAGLCTGGSTHNRSRHMWQGAGHCCHTCYQLTASISVLEALDIGRIALDMMLLRFTLLICLSMHPPLLCTAFLCGDPTRQF